MKRNRGFTLIELLVTIGIIAVLIGILIPVVRGARQSAANAKCASSLRQIGAGLTLYSTNNNGFLPNTDITTKSNWPWDVQRDMVDRFLKTGLTRPTLYCPLESDRQNNDTLWNFAPTYRVLGYFFIIERPNNSFPFITPKAPQKPKYTKKQITDTRGEEEDRELAMDATVSQNGQFTGVFGGWSEPSSSNHLHNGQPMGGNVLFLDGHVEFRGFKSMRIQATQGSVNFWF